MMVRTEFWRNALSDDRKHAREDDDSEQKVREGSCRNDGRASPQWLMMKRTGPFFRGHFARVVPGWHTGGRS